VRFHLIAAGCITTEILPLEFLHRAAGGSARVVLFPGTWNPPSVAHLDIARTALRQADEVIWVLPRVFPHKNFEGPDFEARSRMLRTLVEQTPGFSAAISRGGLYAEIAEEAREHFGPEPEIALVLGRDAAERIAAWNYGKPGVFENFIQRYKLLVAARGGDYRPGAQHAEFIFPLAMESSWDDVSSSEIRRRIAAGEAWRHLVPPQIAAIVESLYQEQKNGSA
jgi:nicotinate-nucleotide adenylyltransferase